MATPACASHRFRFRQAARAREDRSSGGDRTTGSIAAAGREFGMSYRRAWLLADELNRTFDTPLIEAHGGGRNGGGTTLRRSANGL